MNAEEIKLILLGLSQINLLVGNILNALFKDDALLTSREILKQNIVEMNETLKKLEELGENDNEPE